MTDIHTITVSAMPPIIAMPSEISAEDVDEDVAFKVINQDNLPAIAIVGESILPFGRDTQKHKPNVIVHPTRRTLPITSNLEESKQKLHAKSNGAINTIATIANIKQLRKKLSYSSSKLDEYNNNKVDTKFTRTLDAKLRKLQQKEKNNINKVETPMARKPFVTTVKKGEFLEPPPENANGKPPEEAVVNGKKLYAYASQPRVLNRSPSRMVHQSRCEAAAKAAAKITGSVIEVDTVDDSKTSNGHIITKRMVDAPLPYSNLMFEKRIFRGSNFATQNCDHLPKWNPYFAYAKLLSRDEGDGESGAARAAEARRRALARRKAKNQHIKASELRLRSPPPVNGRRHERVQTEKYLEELFDSPPLEDMCTQTDLFVERPVSPFYVPEKTGADVETQIYPGDLFDFDLEVQPILEVLVGKTVEQALIEVLEEEELAALREQQRKFLQIRAAETSEAQRLAESEKRFGREKDRALSDLEEGVRLQKEMEERIAAAVLMQGYIANLLPSVLEGLESEGFLVDNIKQGVDEGFMPWLMKEVTNELQDMVSSRDVLTDMVREILENRAEIYHALNKEPLSEQEEEEGPTMDDLILQDHLKLQEEVAKKQENN